MNKLKVISLLTILFLPGLVLSGCRTLLKFRYEMKQPAEETPSGLIRFLEKNDFPVHSQYVFRDSTAWLKAMRNETIRKNMMSFLIFDHVGRLLEKDTNKCQWAGYDVIQSLNRDSVCHLSGDLRLDDILSCIIPMTTPELLPESSPDFTVVITWAKFLGKYNQRLFVLEKAVKENHTARIRLLYLNIDMQKSWGLVSRQKISVN